MATSSSHQPGMYQWLWHIMHMSSVVTPAAAQEHGKMSTLKQRLAVAAHQHSVSWTSQARSCWHRGGQGPGWSRAASWAARSWRQSSLAGTHTAPCCSRSSHGRCRWCPGRARHAGGAVPMGCQPEMAGPATQVELLLNGSCSYGYGKCGKQHQTWCCVQPADLSVEGPAPRPLGAHTVLTGSIWQASVSGLQLCQGLSVTA
jgi:hypothetical protein